MRHVFQRRWKLIVSLILSGLVIGLAVSWILGGQLCASRNHPVSAPKNLALEEVAFPSASGATIQGWLVLPATNRGIVILQHGIRGCRTDMIDRARFLSAAGYCVLLFDFQAHGESIGKQITFGHLESRDSQAAVTFIKQRFPGQPIGLIGVSLGGSTALLAEPPLDVQALVIELAFPDLVTATKDRLEWTMCRPARLLSPLLTCQIPMRLGVRLDELRPIDCVAKIKTPKLFMNGTRDPRTKFSEAQEMFDRAAEPKVFFPVEGAGHEDLHHFLGERYERLIVDFLEKNLK